VVRGLLGDANAVVQVVPAAWETPVGLEGTSCVYILQLYSLTKVRTIQRCLHYMHL
jgi:hypothetical protein